MHQWTLHPSAGKRFLRGHPWLFSNELAHSPKGIEAGELVKLVDKAGSFLAYGFGNPHSLIAFRSLSQAPDEAIDRLLVLRRLQQASLFRSRLGRLSASYRLCYGEADGLPGLIVDSYATPKGRVFVAEISTAGMERLIGPELGSLLLELGAWQEEQKLVRAGQTTVVIHRESAFRQLEGLAQEAVVCSGALSPEQLAAIEVLLPHRQTHLQLQTDLIYGQKTGLFLDQADNIAKLLELLEVRLSFLPSPLKVLDLCCYVGQWTSQIGALLQNRLPVAAKLVDASAAALQRACENTAAYGLNSQEVRLDVLKAWPEALSQSFDVVICDPPAFVKRSKDKQAGLQAYRKLNSQALQRLAPGGLIVSCSCSGNISEEEFSNMLHQAMRASRRKIRWLYHGGQSADHPRLMEFPEGHYLKCWIGEAIC